MNAPLARAGIGGLRVEGIGAAFGSNTVLHGVDLAVEPGETLVLFGPSGAGKTTLLRAIAGLDPHALGRVTIAGRDVSSAGPDRRDVGVAFQNFALYPHMTARRNITSPLAARGLPAAAIDTRVTQVADLLRIGHVLEQLPRALSNGQKQRTALARALVGEPKVLLLDDPLRNVDAKLRYEMRTELPRLLRRAGAASIYVTQDYREAMAFGDRVAVLIGGRIVQCDAPEVVYDRPGTVDVARLFGDPPLNLVPCRPTRANGAGVRVRALGFDLGLPEGVRLTDQDAVLGVRPEDVRICGGPEGGAAAAEVEAVTPLQDRSVVLLRIDTGEEILASVAGNAPSVGARVFFRPVIERVLLYDAGTGRLHEEDAP